MTGLWVFLGWFIPAMLIGSYIYQEEGELEAVHWAIIWPLLLLVVVLAAPFALLVKLWKVLKQHSADPV